MKSTLLPVEAKLEEVYWQELTPHVEEEDTASQDSKGYETEHNVKPSHSFHQHSLQVFQPPTVCHDHYITDVVRMEMKKLEERLLGVISKRLDNMEYKIDGLVELAVACSTGGGSKKEAGLDDVMEEPEREIMLEEKAGKELVAVKQDGEDENVTDETEYVEK
ncbi:hypothetical protein Fot_44536 [Forsythia ovata]|uniref:Uncharacterized protein n=1 Tax=Forsythia ovata TaxID=205694 RepID=A0ABD1R3T1_9LAMI